MSNRGYFAPTSGGLGPKKLVGPSCNWWRFEKKKPTSKKSLGVQDVESFRFNMVYLIKSLLKVPITSQIENSPKPKEAATSNFNPPISLPHLASTILPPSVPKRPRLTRAFPALFRAPDLRARPAPPGRRPRRIPPPRPPPKTRLRRLRHLHHSSRAEPGRCRDGAGF